MTLLLLMGVPGAGKTTLSHQMLAAFPEAVIFSLDEKVGRFVDNFEAHKSRKDFEAVIRRHLDAVPYPQWQLVIVDDIFYLKSMRRPFERMARLCGFQLLICYVKCDLASAVERNKSRGSDQIPEETIRRIYDQLEVSENCHQFTALSDLVKEIKAAKRWLENNGNFYGTAYQRLWKIKRINDRQIEYNVLASPSNIPITFNECSLFKQYLNLDIDLEKLYADWSAIDPHIRKLLEEFDQLKGIRILYQEPLETLFAFICSANNNIKRISKMVNRLCTLYGTQLQLANNIPSEDKSVIEANSHLLYAFPTVEQMHKYSDNMEAQLRQDSFGYRAQYIAQSVKYLAENKIILESFRYPNKAKECLLKLTGVGPKVADCISLMGLGHHHVVPIDTHVFKSTVKNYRTDLEGKTLTAAVQSSIVDFYSDKFGMYAGWAQAVIFNAQLMNKEGSKTIKASRKRKS